MFGYLRQNKEVASPQFSSGPSCGLHMLYEIQTAPESIVKKVAKDCPKVFHVETGKYIGYKCAFYCFSDTTLGMGEKLAMYIVENDLGEIWETGVRTNPNSGNRIKVWIWAREEEKLQAWSTKKKLDWNRE